MRGLAALLPIQLSRAQKLLALPQTRPSIKGIFTNIRTECDTKCDTHSGRTAPPESKLYLQINYLMVVSFCKMVPGAESHLSSKSLFSINFMNSHSPLLPPYVPPRGYLFDSKYLKDQFDSVFRNRIAC